MATTNLIVDFLVVGVSALWWLAPLLLTAVGTSWIKPLLEANFGAIPLLLGGVYVLGLVISRVADDALKYWNDAWRDEVFGANPTLTYHNRVNAIIAQSESASEYLSYRRSVLRTARSCAVNMGFACIAWAVSGISDSVSWCLAIALSVGSLMAGFALLRAWKVVLRGYFRIVHDMYTNLGRGEQK